MYVGKEGDTAMNLVKINCSRCGRFFESNGFIILCPTCYEKDQKDFERIRQYLYEHPRAKIFQVSTDLDMPVSKLKRYLREGRLEIVEKDNQFLKCEACGKSICSGVYCEDCSRKYNIDIRYVYSGNSNTLRNTFRGNTLRGGNQQIKYLPTR